MTKYSAIVAACTLPLGVNALAAQTQQEKPNVLFIAVDDLGWSAARKKNP